MVKHMTSFDEKIIQIAGFNIALKIWNQEPWIIKFQGYLAN